MAKQTGKIIDIKQVGDKHTAYIECISQSACSSCQSQSSCGVGVVAKGFSSKQHYIEVEYQDGMNIDQSVELQIKDKDLVKGAILAYLVPLLFFIGSAIITLYLELPEIVTILISFTSMTLAYFFINAITKRSTSYKDIHVNLKK